MNRKLNKNDGIHDDKQPIFFFKLKPHKGSGKKFGSAKDPYDTCWKACGKIQVVS